MLRASEIRPTPKADEIGALARITSVGTFNFPDEKFKLSGVWKFQHFQTNFCPMNLLRGIAKKRARLNRNFENILQNAQRGVVTGRGILIAKLRRPSRAVAGAEPANVPFFNVRP